jgi:hypothetical protein
MNQFIGTEIVANVKRTEPIALDYNPILFRVLGFDKLPDGTYLVHTESNESIPEGQPYQSVSRRTGQILTKAQIQSVFGAFDPDRAGHEINWQVVRALLNAAKLDLDGME